MADSKYDVRFVDADHVWVNGRQFVSLGRVGKMIEERQSEGLENCPCCGGPGKLKDSQGRQVRQGWVGCPACGLYISWKISPDGAVRKWNRRELARRWELEAAALQTDNDYLIEENRKLVSSLYAALGLTRPEAESAGEASSSPTKEPEAAP